jgi:hypothetical protein
VSNEAWLIPHYQAFAPEVLGAAGCTSQRVVKTSTMHDSWVVESINHGEYSWIVGGIDHRGQKYFKNV